MKDSYYGILFGIAAIGTLIYAAWTSTKMNKVASKLDLTVEDIAIKSPVKISDALVNAAVTKAVETEVGDKVRLVANRAVDEVRNDISKEVRSTVNTAYEDVKDAVAKELSSKIGSLNLDSIRREVVEKAKERAAEKFEDDLETVLSKYNDDLSNVSRIYSSIANALSGNNSGGATLRIG